MRPSIPPGRRFVSRSASATPPVKLAGPWCTRPFTGACSPLGCLVGTALFCSVRSIRVSCLVAPAPHIFASADSLVCDSGSPLWAKRCRILLFVGRRDVLELMQSSRLENSSNHNQAPPYDDNFSLTRLWPTDTDLVGDKPLS
jgi:hypothetical protein